MIGRPSVSRSARLAVLLAIVVVGPVAQPAAGRQPGQETVTLDVEGMTCPGCEQTIEAVLSGVDGGRGGERRPLLHTAEVTFDSRTTTPSELARAVNTQTYYQARVVGEAGGDAPAATTAGSGTGRGALAAYAGGAAALLLGAAVVWRRRSSTSRAESPSAP